MTVQVAPATLLDMASLLGRTTPTHWRIARQMHAGGEAFAFRAGAELVAIAGFYPLPEDSAEAWFCPCRAADPENGLAAPGARASDLVRAMRLTIRQSAYRAILTVCVTDQGRRIARVLGFRPAPPSDAGEVWRYGRSAEIGGAGR